MSPHQSFRHANSFSFGPSSPASLTSPDAGPNSAYQMQQRPFFFLPSTPKSSQSTASLCANSHRRRYAGNRPRSVVLFPSNTAHSPYSSTTPTTLTNGHQKMMLSQSAPMVVSNHVPPPQQQQSHHPHFHHSSSQQYSKKNSKNCITQQQQYQQQRQRPLSESRGGSPVNCFAGAKFSESPKAQLIPLPPTQWLTDASDCETTTDQNSDNSTSSLPYMMQSKCGSREFSATPSTPSSSFSVQCNVTPTSSTSTSPQQLCRSGPMRMNPLQLIAAVAAS